MESPDLVAFREGSLIFAPETPGYDAAFGILYKKFSDKWYVFWSDTGANHNEHEGNCDESCKDNLDTGIWKLLVY